ncbi:N-6 DNA methylase [Luminiphilus sp.]|nr:N-6 DNA methylase [Luminiphilus sp.]
MPLSWNEIRDRSIRFVSEWENESSEHAEAKSFWDAFFDVFGVSRRRVATFETPIKKADGRDGFIDLLWKGMVVVEHKSRDKNLDAAYDQALGYTHGLSDKELPRYVIVSDFARFRVQNLETGDRTDIRLAELPENLSLFSFIAGYETREYREQDPVNIKAAKKLGELHDALKNVGYEGHSLEVYLVRLLFCLFADDTGIFMPHSAFEDFIRVRTSEDGSDLAPRISQIFETLDTPPEKRLKNLDEQISAFPYVNGRLFEERLHNASFDSDMRRILLDCCELDWGGISPAIFGSLFQGIMDPDVRRNLGAHYTSEKNILKAIGPLFMDDLWAEFKRLKTQKSQLKKFHQKLASLNFLDPACGCGNFLIISYRELRTLELEVIKQLKGSEQQQLSMDAVNQYVKVDVNQFHGIEIEEWPAQIARVAMWLMDHQMNLLVGKTFGQALVRIPLNNSANVIHGNALQLAWETVLPKSKCSFVIGNPPFSGAMVMEEQARKDREQVLSDIPGYGVLDLVSCWYWLTAKYIHNSPIRAALVSTNSITQGEQVALLWKPINEEYGIKIHFAHRTFKWRNEAPGLAAVHCVIVGLTAQPPKSPLLFDYEDAAGEPLEIGAQNINSYLVDAPTTYLTNRSDPLCQAPDMRYGSMPRDGGALILTEEDRVMVLETEPTLAPFIRLFLGAKQLLNGQKRYCLWLVDAAPNLIKNSPFIMARLGRVRDFREQSRAAATRRFANTPGLFAQLAQPAGDYVLLPRHSSQARNFFPMAFMSQENIVADSCLSIGNASIEHFGVLSSSMHMAWLRAICGRIKSDYRYSKDVVYNNFPWPIHATDEKREAISEAAQGVLDARAQFPNATLADLYDQLSMPPVLTEAHRALDKAVDAAYVSSGGKRAWSSEAERVAFLFKQYLLLASKEVAAKKKKAPAKKKVAKKKKTPAKKKAATTKKAPAAKSSELPR